MTVYDAIYSFTKQMPQIMSGIKFIVAAAGFVIFAYSGKVLLTANGHEKGAITGAWIGLFFSTFLISLQRWMDILTTTVYAQNLGPVFMLGEGFENTQNALMIFNAMEIYVIAFGWLGVIGGTFKFIEAPKQNNPGLKRKAAGALFIGVLLANIQFTIDVVGNTVGYDNAYNDLRKELTN